MAASVILDSWADGWSADAWDDVWGEAPEAPPAPIPEVPSSPGWSAYVRQIKRKQRRHKLPLLEEEELIHPEVPESSHAEDATPREIVSAEKLAALLTRGLRQPIAQAALSPKPDDDEDVELLLLSL